ncbi:MAG: hypothetical protein R3F49_10895 [Planctomycetota bacterium]
MKPLLTLIFAFAAAAPISAGYQTAVPKLVEDPSELVGRHRQHPLVQALYQRAMGREDRGERLSERGSGIGLHFSGDHLRALDLAVPEAPTDWFETWPAGLQPAAGFGSVRTSEGWSRLNGPRGPVFERPYPGRPGMKVLARFDTSPQRLWRIDVEADLAVLRQSRRDALRALVPVNGITDDFWLEALGQPVWLDGGEALATWIGLGPGDRQGSHGGVTLALDDRSTLESLTFAADYQGRLPFDLPRPEDRAAWRERLGEPDDSGASSAGPVWTLTLRDHPPLRLSLGTNDGPSEVTLLSPAPERRLWHEIMQGQGEVAPEMLPTIVGVWHAMEQGKSLRGRNLFPIDVARGFVERGHVDLASELSLAGIVAGTWRMYAPGSPVSHAIEYTLRRIRGRSEAPAALLRHFQDPITKAFAGALRCEVQAATEDASARLAWYPAEPEQHPKAPSMTLSCRPVADLVGYDLVLRFEP